MSHSSSVQSFCFLVLLDNPHGGPVYRPSLSLSLLRRRKRVDYTDDRLGLCCRTTFIYQVARRRKRKCLFLFFQQPAHISICFNAFFSIPRSPAAVYTLNTSRVCVKFFTRVGKENTENRLYHFLCTEYNQMESNQNLL